MFFRSLRRRDRCTGTFKGIVAKFAFVVFASNRSQRFWRVFIFVNMSILHMLRIKCFYFDLTNTKTSKDGQIFLVGQIWFASQAAAEFVFVIRSCTHSGPLTVSADAGIIDSVKLLAELFIVTSGLCWLSASSSSSHKTVFVDSKLIKGLLELNTSSSKERTSGKPVTFSERAG